MQGLLGPTDWLIRGKAPRQWRMPHRFPPHNASCAPMGDEKREAHYTSCAALRQRPYRDENTGSLPNSAVKHHRARLVLGWGTAWESLGVLLAFCPFCLFYKAARLRCHLAQRWGAGHAGAGNGGPPASREAQWQVLARFTAPWGQLLVGQRRARPAKSARLPPRWVVGFPLCLWLNDRRNGGTSHISLRRGGSSR